MVVDGDKVFLHIPKCGGTYFRRLLAKNGGAAAFRYWKPPTPEEDDLGHLNLNNFHTYLKPGAYRLHTMIRHPYDRFMSSWQYIKSRFSNAPVDSLGASEEEILGHCEPADQLADFLSVNPRCLYDRACPWIHPQFLYVDDRVETYAYERKEDWHHLLAEFGLSSGLFNELHIKQYPANEALNQKIQQIYQQDYALYEMRVN